MKRILLSVMISCVMTLALALTAMAAPAPPGDITNTATVNYNDTNGQPKPQVLASVTVTVLTVHGVEVTPATDGTSGSNGATVYYTITVRNTGNVVDNYNLTASNTGGWAPTAGSVKFYSDAVHTIEITATGNIAASGTVDVYMSVGVPAGALDGATSVERATATCQAEGTATDFGDYTTTAVGAPSLAATKTSSSDTPVTNDTVIYTITVENTGTKQATNVIITDPIPSGMTYVTSSAVGAGATIEYSHNGGGTWDVSDAAPVTDVKWTWASVAAAGSLTATFQVTVNNNVANNTDIVNTATATSTEQPVVPGGSKTVTVKAPHLTLTKTVLVNGVASANAVPGDTLRYTITAHNDGGSNATGVIIMDTINSYTTYQASTLTVTGGTGSYNAGTVATDPATIAPGGDLIVVFEVKVNQ